HRSVDPNWFNSIQPDIQPVLDQVRSRAGSDNGSAQAAQGAGLRRAVRLPPFLSRPAVVAGVAVAAPDDDVISSGGEAPIVLSVKFIDEDVLADIASRLQLRNLRKVEDEKVPEGDYVFDLTDPQHKVIAQFAWTPQQPGAEIVHSVIPFIAVALMGFA